MNRWPAEGVVDGYDVSEVVLTTGSSCGLQGIGLMSSSKGVSSVCSGNNSDVLSGVNMCDCPSDAVFLGNSLSSSSLASIWVKSAPEAKDGAGVEVFCDLTTRGGGWTTVFTSGSDGDMSPRFMSRQSYDLSTQTLMSRSRSVLLAVRGRNMEVKASVPVAVMEMLPDWRVQHPGSYKGRDVMWPVSVGDDGRRFERKVRYGWSGGSASNMMDASAVCSSDWLTGSIGVANGGLICIEGVSGPLYAGFSSGRSVDVCGSSSMSNSSVIASMMCTSEHTFTISVRD